MKLDRRQRRAIAIICLCCGGLAVDRVFLNSSVVGAAPASASAAGTSTLVDGALPADQAAVLDELKRNAPHATDLNERFGHAIAAVDLRDSLLGNGLENDAYAIDAFGVPNGWRPIVVSDNDSMDAQTQVDRFTDYHHLTAVLNAGQEPMAVINGKPVGIGQSAGGAQLLDVQDRAAHFDIDGRVITLRLSTTP